MSLSSHRPLLITGAAGMIGSQFLKAVQKSAYPTLAVDDLRHFKTRTEHQGLNWGRQIHRSHLFDWLLEEKPEIQAVIHLGAITNTTETCKERLDEWNTTYSQKLWNYCSQKQIPFVYASSAATYGDGAFGYDDDEAHLSQLKPLNLYGESKHQFDLWALDQEKKGNHPPSWSGFKFFNVYGWGERHKNFMASVVLHAFDQIQKSGEVSLFKSHRDGIPDGHQKRDFVFVEDVVQVLRFAFEKPIRRGIFNLGSGKARTYLDLTTTVFKTFNKPVRIRWIETPLTLREKYQYFTQANLSRLRAEGYSAPFTELEVGIQTYVHQLLKTYHPSSPNL